MKAVAGVLGLALAALLGPALLRFARQGPRGVPLLVYLRFSARVRLQRLALRLGGAPRGLRALPPVARLSADVTRVLGANASRMTLQGTNTYLVGAGRTRVLIDASDGNGRYMAALLAACRARGARISHLLLTHGHLDHMGGLLRVREAFPDVQVRKWLPQPRGLALRVSNEESALLGVQPLEDGDEFRVEAADGRPLRLRTVFAPGHHADHTCFVLEGGEQRVLFSGDCVLGEGSCVFDSLRELMASLQRLRDCEPDIIYPAHGPVVPDAIAKIDEYIAHRQQREDQVLEALKAAAADPKPLTAGQIVAAIYEELPFLLRMAACKAVEKHLVKLVADERVRKTPSGWFADATYQLTR